MRTSPLRHLIGGLVVAPWVAWAVVRWLELDGGFPLVAAMSYTPYAAALALACALLVLALGARVVAVVGVVAAVALIAAVVPRGVEGAGLASDEARGTPFVAMTLNLLDGKVEAREILRLVRKYRVDVLSVQELTPQALRQLDAAGARKLLPGRVVRPGAEAAGAGLLARTGLRALRTRTMGGRPLPQARLRVGGRSVLVASVHPVPPLTDGDTRLWRRQLRSLPGPERAGVPRVLLGDFNATLDHRELRRLLARGYRDAADATGDGLRPTWPVGRDRPPITIDHVLLARQILIRRLTLREMPRGDHRALIADLLLADAP
ncbi:MAG TPA: endonuclease/exonuclease/phosphatase family protein [Solirubrobacteraceae bacterium]|nr:endonuclease/exonuclease/phosphatase family protein [Solirubrobacteraceae bacterium]